MKANSSTIQKLVLLFWSSWLSIVTFTNILDGMKAMGILSKDWKFASGNFELILQTTANLGTPYALNAFLFAGVIFLELICSVLFWRAFVKPDDSRIYAAHSVGLLLFTGFVFADEIFFAYSVEPTHMRILFGLMISIGVLILLRRNKEV
ncbi:MAG: hypothetical protein K1X86_00905 [Ignavibacteria bacterium]|nr:hypothetical protein [Ignavibacteria bacterium]